MPPTRLGLFTGLLLLLGVASSSASAQWVTEPVQAPGVHYRVFDSAAVGGPVSFHVFLPPAYEANPDRRFPVLYWLHGSGGGLAGIPVLAQRIGLAIQQGQLPPLIAVFPNGLANGMWCDAASGLQPVESMLMADLIPHIDATLRTFPAPAARVLDGFSMGGYGAARLGLRYSAEFAGFSMLGAGPLQLDFLEKSDEFAPLAARLQIFHAVYGGDMAIYLAQHPWTLAEQHRDDLRPGFAIRQVIGTEDSMLRTNRDLHQRMSDLEIDHEYRELAGVGHSASAVMNAMGADFWRFHRQALAGAERVFAGDFEWP